MEDIVIVGRHAVKEAIVSGHTINKIWIQEGIRKQQINDILQNAKEQKLIVQTVPKSKLDNLANAPHQGVAALLHHMNMLISINLFNLKRIKKVYQL